jgi:hypothetical protein
MIVSIFAFRASLQLIHAIRSAFEFVDQTIVVNDLGISWVIQILRPKQFV